MVRAYSRGILAVGGEGLFNGILVVGDSVYNYEGLCIPPVYTMFRTMFFLCQDAWPVNYSSFF